MEFLRRVGLTIAYVSVTVGSVVLGLSMPALVPGAVAQGVEMGGQAMEEVKKALRVTEGMSEAELSRKAFPQIPMILSEHAMQQALDQSMSVFDPETGLDEMGRSRKRLAWEQSKKVAQRNAVRSRFMTECMSDGEREMDCVEEVEMKVDRAIPVLIQYRDERALDPEQLAQR